MKSRNLWLIVSLLVIGSMLLVSCGTNPAGASGAYLTINFEQVPTWVRNFNPFSASPLGSTGSAIYEPMMIYNKSTGKLVPWLATDYSWNADNTLLTFKIRPNVKWSDGQSLSAQDVVYTFNLMKNNDALIGTACRPVGGWAGPGVGRRAKAAPGGSRFRPAASQVGAR